jgi:hypothetical protein
MSLYYGGFFIGQRAAILTDQPPFEKLVLRPKSFERFDGNSS